MPSSARPLRPSSAARSLSNSARCTSVKNSWFAYLGERCKGVSDSSVQMACRSGSPHAVFNADAEVAAGAEVFAGTAGDCAEIRVMETEIVAATATVAIAAVIIGRENQVRMMFSSCSSYRTTWLIERILFKGHNTLHVVAGYRSRHPSFRKGGLFHAPSTQQPREAIVSLDAARLVINPVFLLVLFGEHLLDRPWPRPHHRIFDPHRVLERVGSGPRPPLDQMQVLTRALVIRLGTEIRHIDYQRIALPMAARIAIPLADAGGQVRTSGHDNVPLPPLALTHVVEHRDAARCLYNSTEAPAERGSKLGQSAGQAPAIRPVCSRTIIALDVRQVVARRS